MNSKHPTVKTHPIAEIIGKRLLGIEIVPDAEKHKMIQRTAKHVCAEYDKLRDDNERLRKCLQELYHEFEDDVEIDTLQKIRDALEPGWDEDKEVNDE